VNDDPLRQLLELADRPPSLVVPARHDQPADLAASIIRRHARRQWLVRVGTSGVVVAAILIVSSVLLWRVPESTHPHVIAATLTADSKLELARLDQQAQVHARTAELLLAGEKRRASQRRAAQRASAADIDDQVLQQRAEAALTIVRSGDRLRTTYQLDDAAAAEYRRAIDLFPETPAAAVAARRLGRPPI
jgi:hypothetical protein